MALARALASEPASSKWSRRPGKCASPHERVVLLRGGVKFDYAQRTTYRVISFSIIDNQVA